MGDADGFEFCNCHAVVQRGRMLKRPCALTHLSSVPSTPCESCLLNCEVALSTCWGQVLETKQSHFGAISLGSGFALPWIKNNIIQPLRFFSYSAYLTLTGVTRIPYHLVFLRE